ncbi:MAG: hypothetical protein ACO1SX_21935 [Actinomycetota bacterium]
MRTLIGLVVGVALFLLGVPVLQSVMIHTGYYDQFTYEQAVLAMLLILATVVAAQLTALKPPPKDRR